MHERKMLTRLGEEHLMHWVTLNRMWTCNLLGQSKGEAKGPMTVRPWSRMQPFSGALDGRERTHNDIAFHCPELQPVKRPLQRRPTHHCCRAMQPTRFSSRAI
jgi:hypothetical protein